MGVCEGVWDLGFEGWTTGLEGFEFGVEESCIWAGGGTETLCIVSYRVQNQEGDVILGRATVGLQDGLVGGFGQPGCAFGRYSRRWKARTWNPPSLVDILGCA